jgi:hypothetical protein
MRQKINLVFFALCFFSIGCTKSTPGVSSTPANDAQSSSGAVLSAPQDSIWVGKTDDAKSCGTAKPVTLDQAAADFAATNIQFFQKKKIHDGKMRIQMCGTDKGDMNGFLISKKDLQRAEALGFKAMP